MSSNDDLFDQVFDALKDEFDGGKNRLSQEEVDRRKRAPDGSSLVVASARAGSPPTVRLPTVRPPVDNRRGRKAAEAEQERQWRMVQTANRTGLANESMAAVAVHAYEVTDRMQNSIADRFYAMKRPEAMNELMKQFGAKCLRCGVSGILAIVESHPKRISEDL